MLTESLRLGFQNKLETILGSRNVYFQPPSSISMKYPCIVYSYDDEREMHADNLNYIPRTKISVILITKQPNPEDVLRALGSFTYSSFDRHYTEDNLHHFAFTVYI